MIRFLISLLFLMVLIIPVTLQDVKDKKGKKDDLAFKRKYIKKKDKDGKIVKKRRKLDSERGSR